MKKSKIEDSGQFLKRKSPLEATQEASEPTSMEQCYLLSADSQYQSLCSIMACAGENHTYLSPADELSSTNNDQRPRRFPIIAANAYNEVQDPDEQYFMDIENCGFTNVICFPYLHNQPNPNYVDRVVDQVEHLLYQMRKTSLFLILSLASFRMNASQATSTATADETTESDPEYVAMIKRLRDQTRITGWYQKYYPYQSEFSNLNKIANAIRENDPYKRIVIDTMVGGMYGNFAGVCKSLPSLLNAFEYEMKPPVWCFLVVPISIKNPTFPPEGGYSGTEIKISYEDFYDDLELFSSKSRSTHVPFWGACQSTEMYNASIKYARPAATELTLRFEAFSALAYGAQALVYFDYSTAVNSESSTDKYVSALTDSEGSKTPAWYAAQKINNEVQAWKDIFLGCQLIDIKHVGQDFGMYGCGMSYPFGPLVKIEKTEGASLLVSLLGNTISRTVNGKEESIIGQYIMFLNKSLSSEVNVRPLFDNYRIIYRQYLDTSEAGTGSSSGLIHKEEIFPNGEYLTLKPSEYVILRWE